MSDYSEEDYANAAAASKEENALREMMSGSMEITTGEYNKHIITPDRGRCVDTDGVESSCDLITRKWFTKELKVSNLRRDEQDFIITMTDVGLQLDRLLLRCGGYDVSKRYFSDHILDVRDTVLASSSSVGAKERELQVSTKNIAEIRKDGKKGLFFGKKD